MGLLLLIVTSEAWAQNTKGDRPVNNQRQVRETRSKSVKKKERGGTRDIAGRRLRTKDKSSANRANFKYPQPSPYSSKAVKSGERAAKPTGRVFTKSPRESKTRAWKGDVSGYRIRRVQPGKSEAARHNVYPQKGPYQRFVRKREKEKPPTYARTIKGERFVKHEPRVEERAWIGGTDKGPIKNKSISAKQHKVYSQEGPYVSYYNRKSRKGEKAVSNYEEISSIKKYSATPRSKAGKRKVYPASKSKSYVQHGRRNVYWGKIQRKERPVTTDLTGGPLRTRNYRSPRAGLVGRDTLEFFGRKPMADGSARTSEVRYSKNYKQGEKSWSGDISGYRLKKGTSSKTFNGFLFPKKNLPKPGIAGTPLSPRQGKSRSRQGQQAQLNPIPSGAPGGLLSGKGHGIKKQKGGGSISAGWNNKGNPLAGKAPGIGAAGIAGYKGNVQVSAGFSTEGPGDQGKIRRKDVRRAQKHGEDYKGFIKGAPTGFESKGSGYSGNIRRRDLTKPQKNGVDYRGFSKNFGVGYVSKGIGYSGNIKRKDIRGFSSDYIGYRGNMKRSEMPGFSQEGAGYSGNIRRSQIGGFEKGGAGYAGNIKRSQIRGFEKGGAGYSGNIKRSQIPGFEKGGAGYSGNIKRSQIPGFEKGGAGYSGNIKRSQIRGFEKGGLNYRGNIQYVGRIKSFENQGEGYPGALKAHRPGPGDSGPGAGFQGKLKRSEQPSIERQGAGYSGNIRRSTIRGFDRQGAGFAGNLKAKRKEKGGGSISGPWNNEGRAIATKAPLETRGPGFAGNVKFKKPEKGGGSVSGKLWNNEGKAVAVRTPLEKGGADYSGNIKFKKPEKGGGSRSGRLWNNDGTAIAVRTPLGEDAKAAGYSGKIARSRFKRDYVQNPNADKESLKKQAINKGYFALGDLKIKTKERSHGRTDKTSKEALASLKPGKGSVNAGEYARSMKMTWNYKHNPNSDREALKTIGPSRATARIQDYQGNLKMHKYTAPSLHPDAPYAHSQRDNVKGERTFLMNVKLTWSKLFRKNETQPEVVKQKPHRPRYDKREKGLWYD
ncbi:MAG: hypothetical protein JST14_01370 [Bacteroidetes bacterium]|nr:hypothetical protein [Bacteroidota bacterium]